MTLRSLERQITHVSGSGWSNIAVILPNYFQKNKENNLKINFRKFKDKKKKKVRKELGKGKVPWDC